MVATVRPDAGSLLEVFFVLAVGALPRLSRALVMMASSGTQKAQLVAKAQFVQVLQSGRVALLWLGPPCQTFSWVRNLGGHLPPLRGAEHVEGLPTPWRERSSEGL